MSIDLASHRRLVPSKIGSRGVQWRRCANSLAWCVGSAIKLRDKTSGAIASCAIQKCDTKMGYKNGIQEWDTNVRYDRHPCNANAHHHRNRIAQINNETVKSTISFRHIGMNPVCVFDTEQSERIKAGKFRINAATSRHRSTMLRIVRSLLQPHFR